MTGEWTQPGERAQQGEWAQLAQGAGAERAWRGTWQHLGATGAARVLCGL
ncbi:hypothetical protein R6G85_06885 [Actinotignum urinale]|nr:hypothetical protein [Actinotignum urinale]MDY5152198.1 hypothetical protein [Actinotignum urinale]